MGSGITVVIPTIPPRAMLLARAVHSVARQTLPAEAISIAVDVEGLGAPATRQAALDAVRTPWVAFLDDDDEFEPEHLQVLHTCAVAEQADYVFSYYRIVMFGSGGVPTDNDPVLGHFGRPFDPEDPHQTTITTLVRTELAKSVGFIHPNNHGEYIEGQIVGEDFRFTQGCVAAGAKIVHVAERTWRWHHDSGNTSGRSWTR